MLCLKAEVDGNMYASSHHRHHGSITLPVNLGRSIQRVMSRVARGGGGSTVDGTASCSGLEDDKSNEGSTGERRQTTYSCRSQLEKEVERLQKQLQEEIDLHVTLVDAVAHNSVASLNSPSKLPYKTQELLNNVLELEMTISKLEDELVTLHLQLCQERHLSENFLGCSPSLFPELPATSSACGWEEHISSLRASKFGLNMMPSSHQPNQLSGCGDLQLVIDDRDLDRSSELLESYSSGEESMEPSACLEQTEEAELRKCGLDMNFWQCPNLLSEEMVRCMRNIYLCLSESSDISSSATSLEILSSSPHGPLSSSSFTSFSDSSVMSSKLQNHSTRTNQSYQMLEQVDGTDPYGVNDKVDWGDIGNYALAAEVSWMSVGKSQLNYAAEALKRFRFLVEQLAIVNPACLTSIKKLAFWINVYNALIMHAYLAYGVPKSDTKLFSLMQKACYTVGGQSISAAEIEFLILKMKPPAHRPQLALILALHKFKVSEELRNYSIDSPEPLAIFALSSGMYSSPALRVYTVDNVQEELRNSMRDYIRASISISDKGKLLIPKLLHSFAKCVVEDSLLVDWICRYLSPDQVAIVRDSTSQRKRLLGVRGFSVIPFDSRSQRTSVQGTVSPEQFQALNNEDVLQRDHRGFHKQRLLEVNEEVNLP